MDLTRPSCHTSITVDGGGFWKACLPIEAGLLTENEVMDLIADQRFPFVCGPHFLLRDDTLQDQGKPALLDKGGPWLLDEGHRYTVQLGAFFLDHELICCLPNDQVDSVQ